MNKASSILIMGLALAIGGCSSSMKTTRVSYAEPAYTQPASYQYADTGYSPVAYDRDYSHDAIRQTRTTYQFGPDSTEQRLTTRTVNMPAATTRHSLTLDEFRRHVNDETAVIVDAREPRHFSGGHVRGAVNIPAGSEESHLDRLRGVGFDELIIVYCGGPDCPAGDNVATYLASQGYTNIRVFTPGWQQLSQTDLTQ